MLIIKHFPKCAITLHCVPRRRAGFALYDNHKRKAMLFPLAHPGSSTSCCCTVITITPGAALQWPQGPVTTRMEAVAVLCMPRGCTSALLLIGKETLAEAPRNTALMPAQAGVHIGHRHRCARALCSTVLHRQAAAAVTVAPVAPGQSGR
jgi:hypothetical protein